MADEEIQYFSDDREPIYQRPLGVRNGYDQAFQCVFAYSFLCSVRVAARVPDHLVSPWGAAYRGSSVAIVPNLYAGTTEDTAKTVWLSSASHRRLTELGWDLPPHNEDPDKW